MEIYMIRHGQTQWNKEKRLQGRSDIPLNEYGIRLAEVTALALESIPFTRIYTSPLSRAKETARILLHNRSTAIIEDDRLLEMSFGEGEGERIDTIYAQPQSQIYNFIHDPQNYLPPAGGESFEQLYSRCHSFLREVVLPAEASCDYMMIVAHGALIRGLIHAINGRPTKDFWITTHKNCSVTIASCTEGHLQLKEEAKIYYTQKVEATW
ncbi:MAG: histidine phosphatase family protein [Lachnospiraceae bacterium]